MIETLSRRLRVRDDGTGKERERDCTFAEFETEDAVILLGDPGMGKTTLFKAASNTNYTTVRSFLIDPHYTADESIFLDALDEYRTVASGQDASAEVAKALCSLKKPKFRLSCRAADWFGSMDQEVLRAASASGRIVILELCPLSKDEILNAVQGKIPDPVAFLDEAESVGLGHLLGNPQTLELVALAWGTDRKPQNKFEAYEIGVSKLLKEPNPRHVVRGASSPDPRALRKAASAAASTLLLSNSVGISRTEPTDGNGYVGFSVVPYSNTSDLDAVLHRRLFTFSEVDRFEPIHRTIAEFLAAEDLAQRIEAGLPIDRVMALICGIDGRPVSSLRGLLAWLMCRLGDRAEGYIERDPYGVATYGDASILPPKAQCEIWASLRKLRDPWFLTNEDDRGSFRDLANLNTAKIIHELLRDPATGVHLKIAVLEAIANSTENIGLNTIIRDLVLDKHDNTWLRSTALRAFVKSIQNDWAQLESLDSELSQATDDHDAPDVRVELLRLTQAFGNLPLRLISIIKQAASAKKERHTIGRFYSLIDLPSGADLDVILDTISWEFISGNKVNLELQWLFDEWLKHRLESLTEIKSTQLVNWLRNTQIGHGRHFKKAIIALKLRFEQNPFLFEEIFDLLVNTVPNEDVSFSRFVAYDLWHILPATSWPVPQSKFFLACAETENDPERAADLFHMYLSWFPPAGLSVALTETGFDFLNRRNDVEKVLGNWNVCEISKDQIEYWKRLEKEQYDRSVNRAQNVADLTPRLTTIREGGEEHALVWASRVYQGLFYDIQDIPDARDRLVSVTNDEIADAFIEGFIRYAENPTIPTKNAVIEEWLANKTPYTHTLLSLSVFLRLNAGMIVPQDALPNCIAAVVRAFGFGGKIPEHDETLSSWLRQEALLHPVIVRAVLSDFWVASTTVKERGLPGFYELSHDPGCQQFLASVSADVLKAQINDDHDTVVKLVSVLLRYDQRVCLAIGESELTRAELSVEVRAIWHTALFVIDPGKHLEPWRTLMSEPDTALWEVIKILGGGRYEMRDAVRLTSLQRTEVIASVGRRFANVRHPRGGWIGSQNPWVASEFVANQIKLLAADGSPDVDAQFERLENDESLASYRDVIRHHRAQNEKQKRESSFVFASSDRVVKAILNRAPATPNDLLAFIVDHLNVLAYELTRTQRERYRAYWNESGRDLVKPKREEVCSGLLAEDLQNRMRAHNLIVTVEHHMVADKECDLVVLQGIERLLPIEVKHLDHPELWTAWRTQLDRLYTRDAKAGGLGIYLILWSGEAKGRKMPRLPEGLERPANASELRAALESLIPEGDRHRLRVVVVDISVPS